MFGLGMPEVLVLLTVGLLLFGNRLPDLARSLGKTLSELRREMDNVQEDFRSPTR